MPPATTTLLLTHPGWTLLPGGVLGRLLPKGGGTWYARWDGQRIAFTALDEQAAASPEPRIQHTQPGELPPDLPETLTLALNALGTVVHVPTPDLWDTITAQLLRSTTPDGPLYAVLRPEQIPHLLPVGRPLKANEAHLGYLADAASFYQDRHTEWQTATADVLAAALRRIRGVGKRSTALAAADHSGRQLDDPTLRTSAYQAARGRLPQQQRPFAELWQRWSPRPRQRHALNAFCLAHSGHAQLAGAPGAASPPGRANPRPAQALALAPARSAALPGYPFRTSRHGSLTSRSPSPSAWTLSRQKTS